MPDNTNSDGSGSVARESKFALLTQFALSVLATGAIGWLGTLNLSTLPGWATAAATLAVSTAVGFLTAYVTKNKVARR